MKLARRSWRRYSLPSILTTLIRTSRRRAAFLTVLSMLVAGAAHAQGYRVGQIQETVPLVTHPGNGCGGAIAWYAPEVFNHPNGDIGLIAQSLRPPGPSCTVGAYIDSFYAARRSSAGNWTLPSAASCPTLSGESGRCGFEGPLNTSPIGRRGIVKVDSTYYMAFTNGNPDYFDGKVYWATSSDAISWNVYSEGASKPNAGGTPFANAGAAPAGDWTPILGARYQECACGGIADPLLVYDAGDTSTGPNGTFYIYFTHYAHHEPVSNDNCVQLLGPRDTWGYRFDFDPTRPGGLGDTRQIWHRETGQLGAWKATSGELVWNYDLDAGHPAVPGEPVLEAHHGRIDATTHLRFGDGTLKRDPISGKWLHMYAFGGTTYSQSADSLAANVWSAPIPINMATITNAFPDHPSHVPPIQYAPGTHYDTRGGRTGWWIYVPVNHLQCQNAFVGLGIVSAELCSNQTPTASTVAPASGSVGTTVTVHGAHLDCATSVTFGGVAANIVSREPGRVTVVAPSHGFGAVNVIVTTPAGAVTRTNAFTYTTGSPLQITQQPLSRSVQEGGAVTFQVAASGGTPSYSYRWQFRPTGGSWSSLSNGSGISGAFTSTLSIDPVALSNRGEYRCQVTDSASPPVQVTSNAAILTVTALPTCTPNSLTLCLNGDRFAVTVDWVVHLDDTSGSGTAIPHNSDTGFFWFFNPSNIELAVKVLQNPLIPGNFWVFFGGLTDVQYTVTVTDVQTNEQRVYFTAAENLCGGSHTDSFPIGSAAVPGGPASELLTERLLAIDLPKVPSGTAAASGTCVPSSTALCLVGNRFRVQVGWQDPAGQTGTGKAVPLTDETGALWFFSPNNVELLVKMLDGTAINGKFWMFFGSLSDVQFNVTVTDTTNGQTKIYSNAQGEYCGQSDTSAFPLP